ncbi:gp195 [Bacillus phage W.Ph.]|uniref:Gp195 n=1 Tax=Bacillus phage W.Ph. TaxID=764595 RepID=G9B1U6_9CAUD|nr:gp195 [Bacillus phage W.Ph.]ADH03341.1 gp195 [Bacillus phage W.Ph.]
MTKVNEFHIACDVVESDSITVTMNDKGMTNIFMYVSSNDEPITKHQVLTRFETLELIKLLSICMFDDVKRYIRVGIDTEDNVSFLSEAHRKRAYLYMGMDCIALNRTTCRRLRDELERGLN